MAIYVNPATVQAASRMFGIFLTRNTRENDKNGGVFVVRIPSYDEFPEWREKVEGCVETLFGGCSEMNTRRDWTVEHGGAELVHTMRMFAVPKSVSWRDSLANVALRSKSAFVELGFDAGSAERLGTSLERAVGEMNMTEDEKEAGTLARDILSKIACAVQYPWFIDVPEDSKTNAFDALRSTLFSPDFGKSLGEAKDTGLVQAHVFGVSPFGARCTDLFSFKKGEKGTPRGIEIGIGWDALLNARPAINALVDALGKGGFFGEDRPVRAEIKQTKKRDGNTGDPYGIQDMSGKKLFIPVPAWVKNKENPFPGGETAFVSAVLHMVSPWLNPVVQPDGLRAHLGEKDALSPKVLSNVDAFIEKVSEASNIYAVEEVSRRAALEERSKSVEKGMDLESRLVPYPGKKMVYVLLKGTEEETQNAREIISDEAAVSGLRNPEWSYNKKFGYSYTYLSAEQDAEKNPLVVYEGRKQFADRLSEKVRESGFDITSKPPVSLDVTLRVGGLAGKKGEKWILVEVPAALDKELRSAAKKGAITTSSESEFLSEAKKILVGLTSDEDEECTVGSVGDMTQVSSDDAKTVFGINVTADGRDREKLESHVAETLSFLEDSVLSVAKEKHPNVDVGVKVRWSQDEKIAEREKGAVSRAEAWKAVIMEAESVSMEPSF